MTSQITFPDYYTKSGEPGGYPNIENLLKTLFTSGPVGLGGVDVYYWLPAQAVIEETLAADRGILRIFRTGGKINRSKGRDEPNVQLAALTKSRDRSWELIEFARTGVLEEFEDGAIVPGTIHKLQSVGELIGPQLIPEQIRDERLVPVTFTLLTWKPKGLGNYREALGL